MPRSERSKMRSLCGTSLFRLEFLDRLRCPLANDFLWMFEFSCEDCEGGFISHFTEQFAELSSCVDVGGCMEFGDQASDHPWPLRPDAKIGIFECHCIRAADLEDPIVNFDTHGNFLRSNLTKCILRRLRDKLSGAGILVIRSSKNGLQPPPADDPTLMGSRSPGRRLDFPNRPRAALVQAAMKRHEVQFIQLSDGWNAEPNAPDETVSVDGDAVVLEFAVNAFLYPEFVEGSRAQLRFQNCLRFRLGSPNDEGWYRGQCRFSSLAPKWGEFYLVSGEGALLSAPTDWVGLTSQISSPRNHYLFYLRDSTFECEAEAFSLGLPERK